MKLLNNYYAGDPLFSAVDDQVWNVMYLSMRKAVDPRLIHRTQRPLMADVTAAFPTALSEIHNHVEVDK